MTSAGIHNTRAQNKKRREGKRIDFTAKQLEELEILFANNQNPDKSTVSEFLSKNKGITEGQVTLWFTKRRSSEAIKNDTPTAKRAKKSNPVANALQIKKQTMKDGRRVFTDEQLKELEEEFQKNQNLNSSHMKKIADKMGVEKEKVQTWFKNRKYKHNLGSKMTDALNGERATTSNGASNATEEMQANNALNATQETEANNASNATRETEANYEFIASQETKTNAESTAANKENTSPNFSEIRKEVSENQVQAIDPYLNFEKVNQQTTVKYVRDVPFEEM